MSWVQVGLAQEFCLNSHVKVGRHGSFGQEMTDYRIDNAKWTRGAVLQFKKYVRYREGWEHDHCSGCWATFMEPGHPDVLTEGYATEDNYRWICEECFRDLKEEMGWTLVRPTNS